MLKKTIRSSRCPRCKIRCTPIDTTESSDDICLAYGPKEMVEVMKNEDDLKVRVWSYMRPPKISDPTPAVNPDRLEKVRDLLSPTHRDKAYKTHIDSDLSIQVLQDGSVRKMRSLKEVKIFAPVMQMPKSASKKYCLPNCSNATEKDVTELFKNSSCSNPPKL